MRPPPVRAILPGTPHMENSMRATLFWVLAFLGFFAAHSASAADNLAVTETIVPDEKAVFGQVESVHITQARARIGGTLASIEVREGDHVEAGQRLGTV